MLEHHGNFKEHSHKVFHPILKRKFFTRVPIMFRSPRTAVSIVQTFLGISAKVCHVGVSVPSLGGLFS